jgi:hypothetical protein
MEGRLPDFLIIGAMKAGTTSLHDYLGMHPDIFTSSPKEIHFFADEKYFNHNIEWYKRHFITEKILAGTSPQNYTKCHNKYYQHIPERLKAYLPEIKLIYILRDPIERYRSHILENYFTESTHDVRYNIKSDHYVKTGMYFMQLQAYLLYFNLTQIHILTLEELESNRLNCLNRIFRFLGVSELQNDRLFNFVSNNHRDKTVPYYVKSSLIYRAARKVAPKLSERVITHSNLKFLFKRKGEKKLLSEKELDRLKTIYSEDVKQLRKLTGFPFDKWSV